MTPTSWFSLLVSLASGLVLPQRQGLRTLSPEEVAAFKPYTWYAATTSCQISDIKTWTCGKNCDANPTFKPIATGGDGSVTQFWFSGYDPTLNEVIVSHQGTNTSEICPILIDLDVFLVRLDSKLFPGIKSSVRVHGGFAGTHSRSATGVIAAVKQALSQYPTKNVTVVGHSLGAAIALLDAMYLPLHLPPDVTVRYIGYASPRVGNKAFADYVDAQGMSITRINNKQDAVPIVPPMGFKIFRWKIWDWYHHASGEIHIRDDDVWVACPGQDNPSNECSTGAATSYEAPFQCYQHKGPFDGVTMGRC